MAHIARESTVKMATRPPHLFNIETLGRHLTKLKVKSNEDFYSDARQTHFALSEKGKERKLNARPATEIIFTRCNKGWHYQTSRKPHASRDLSQFAIVPTLPGRSHNCRPVVHDGGVPVHELRC